ncbi:MAG: M16 family metallopeptidase [Promethearchaeota archaeon]
MDISTFSSQHLKSITIVLGFQHGVAYEKKPGLASILLPMLSRGTMDHSEEEINILLESNGIKLFTNVAQSISSIGIRCIPGEAENAMDLLFEIISRPLLNDSILETQKQNSIQKIMEINQDPFSRITEVEIFKSIFGESHPLSKHILGDIDSIKSINRDDLFTCLKNNLLINPHGVIIGNFEDHEFRDSFKEDLVQVFLAHLEKISDFISLKKQELLNVSVKPKNLHVHEDTTINNLYFGLNYRTPPNLTNPWNLKFLSTLLGGTLGSRMFRIIRDEKGLSYIAGSFSATIMHHGYFTCIMDVDKNRIEEGINTLQEIIQDVVDNGISDEEMDFTKESLLSAIELSLDNPRWIAGEILNNKFNRDSTNPYLSYQMVEKIDKSSLIEWSKKVIKNENLSLAVDGNITKQEMKKYWNMDRE